MNGSSSLNGARVLVTGAARGIGAALAARLHRRGARVALAGLEPERLELVASACGGAPWVTCDVRDRPAVDAAVASLVEQLGGLDVVVANAGVAAQLPIVGGNPETFEQTIEVNLLGTYYTLRACGPHLLHERGYALAIASLGGAVHLPLMGAYAASKSGVEALANSLRAELRPSGTRVGVAYFAELDTDMTRRGFGTRAAREVAGRTGAISGVSPLAPALDAPRLSATGCPYQNRCPHVMPRCRTELPPAFAIDGGGTAACFLHAPDAGPTSGPTRLSGEPIRKEPAA